jgi:hypothetical protein
LQPFFSLVFRGRKTGGKFFEFSINSKTFCLQGSLVPESNFGTFAGQYHRSISRQSGVIALLVRLRRKNSGLHLNIPKRINVMQPADERDLVVK